MVRTRSLSSGARSRDPVALPTISACPGIKKLFRVSDMRLDVRPRGARRQTFGARAMMQQGQTAKTQIKALIDAWADAVRRHDLSGILAHHDQDIVMFDVPPPLQSRGMAAYKKTWDLFFAYHQPGQAFDVEELQMCVGDTVAFAVAIMRCR